VFDPSKLACPRVEPLPANIRLGWRGLPGTNDLAYYKNLQITAVKVLYYRPLELKL
jgi:hypothetical protein